jgi:hypothetical protein
MKASVLIGTISDDRGKGRLQGGRRLFDLGGVPLNNGIIDSSIALLKSPSNAESRQGSKGSARVRAIIK